MKSHKEEAEILRSCGISLGNWLGNGLTEEGFLAKVDLSNLEKLGLREPYSHDDFSIANLLLSEEGG